ncbi:MAG: chloride channel protein [Thiolinea sp.]
MSVPAEGVDPGRPLSLGCGASVGQYGPMVYLGSMLGDLIERLHLYIPNLRSIAIACGVAAAIATAFNAPIAGLLFAHEVILRHYSLQAFAPTTVAAATGYVMANEVFEQPPLFLVDFAGVSHSYEFALFALLGMACALLATLFMQLILRLSAFAVRSRITPVWRPAWPDCWSDWWPWVCPMCWGPGGKPCVFATIEGAFTRRRTNLAGQRQTGPDCGVHQLWLCRWRVQPVAADRHPVRCTVLDPAGMGRRPEFGVAAYAICGMMALSSPVMGSPLTTILIVFELTRNYDLTIAAMIAVVFANLLGFRLFWPLTV